MYVAPYGAKSRHFSLLIFHAALRIPEASFSVPEPLFCVQKAVVIGRMAAPEVGLAALEVEWSGVFFEGASLNVLCPNFKWQSWKLTSCTTHLKWHVLTFNLQNRHFELLVFHFGCGFLYGYRDFLCTICLL